MAGFGIFINIFQIVGPGAFKKSGNRGMRNPKSSVFIGHKNIIYGFNKLNPYKKNNKCRGSIYCAQKQV